MELDGITQGRIAVGAVVLVALVFWLSGVLTTRRRKQRFSSLASSFGSEVTYEGEFRSKFDAQVEGRAFEIRSQHLNKWGWCLVTETALAGVSALHAAEIRPRLLGGRNGDQGAVEFGERFAVRDLGLPLRDGWLDERLKKTIIQFYAFGLSRDPLVIEEGCLVHRARVPLRRFEGGPLVELIKRQAAIASALERAL